MSLSNKPVVPMTVLGGFLGAGKTTLLNRLLSENTGVRYGVMVNDFGELSVDDRLITGQDGDTMTFANGCVCCTLGDSFLTSLDDMLDREPAPEQIIVEASGVADPRAISDMAVLHPCLVKDLTLVLADAGNIKERSEDARLADTVNLQLKAADLILLNKCDLVSDTERAELRAWLSDKSGVPVLTAEHGQLPLDILRQDPATSETSEPAVPHHHHNHDVVFSAITLPVDGPLDRKSVRAFLKQLPTSILRVKGFFREAEGLVLLQWCGGQADFRAAQLSETATGFVVIGTTDMPSLESLREALNAAS